MGNVCNKMQFWRDGRSDGQEADAYSIQSRDTGQTHAHARLRLRMQESLDGDQHPQISRLPQAVRPSAGDRSDRFSMCSGAVGPGQLELRMVIPARERSAKLVYDRDPLPGESDISYFRSTNDLSLLPDSVDKTGMRELRLSGGASLCSTKQVERIMEVAGTTVLYYVVLREEPNAVVNGLPVTLRSRNDWVNVGVPFQQIIEEEDKMIAGLRRQEEVTLYRGRDIKEGVTQPKSIALRRPTVTSARQLVESVGARFFRIAVTDHSRPSRKAVDVFIHMVRGMPEGAALHLQCLGARGRTTTFMILYDMLFNAQYLPADVIIERQCRLGYDYQMIKAQPPADDKAAMAEDRLDFLYMFYEYAKQNPGGRGLLYSEWRETTSEQSDLL